MFLVAGQEGPCLVVGVGFFDGRDPAGEEPEFLFRAVSYFEFAQVAAVEEVVFDGFGDDERLWADGWEEEASVEFDFAGSAVGVVYFAPDPCDAVVVFHAFPRISAHVFPVPFLLVAVAVGVLQRVWARVAVPAVVSCVFRPNAAMALPLVVYVTVPMGDGLVGGVASGDRVHAWRSSGYGGGVWGMTKAVTGRDPDWFHRRLMIWLVRVQKPLMMASSRLSVIRRNGEIHPRRSQSGFCSIRSVSSA